MANVQIYQLDNAGSDLDNSALLACDITNPDASERATTPKVTRKISVAELESQVLNDEEYTTELNTTNQTIFGAINEHHSVIGYNYDAYDATTAYAKDDLCIYNNVLYKALQATTGNLPTNTTYWEQTSIADEIGRIDTALSGIDNDIRIISATKTQALIANDVTVVSFNFNVPNGYKILVAYDDSYIAKVIAGMIRIDSNGYTVHFNYFTTQAYDREWMAKAVIAKNVT